MQHLGLLKMIKKGYRSFSAIYSEIRSFAVAKKISPETLGLFPDDIKINHLELLKMSIKRWLQLTCSHLRGRVFSNRSDRAAHHPDELVLSRGAVARTTADSFQAPIGLTYA